MLTTNNVSLDATADPPLSPVQRRALADFAHAAHSDRIAVLLGAGTDRSILRGACDDWLTLVKNTKAIPNPYAGGSGAEEKVKAAISSWTTEIAYLGKLRLGDEDLVTSLRGSLGEHPGLAPAVEDVPGLVEVLKRASVVVSLNYTSHIRRFLDHAQLSGAWTRPIRVYDRRDLPVVRAVLRSADAPNGATPLPLVYLHGRFGRHDITLDAWGYSSVENEDPHYRELLRELFAHYSVLTHGVSWTDIPLREAAAFVCRTRPYAVRTHVALRYEAGSDEQKVNGIERAVGAALRAVSGIGIVHTTQKTQSELLAQSVRPRPPIDVSGDSLESIAGALDACGDYESAAQHSILDTAADTTVRALAARVLAECDASQDSWRNAARIESHLRHHLYMLDGGATNRNGLWARLRGSGQFSTSTLDGLAPRARLDFLLGRFECGYAGVASAMSTGDSLLDERLSLASDVWITRSTSALERALDCGWESIAAKSALDHVLDGVWTAKGPTAASWHTPDADWDTIVNRADRAAGLARAAGVFRRLVKADILRALWDPSAEGGARHLRERLFSIDREGGIRVETRLHDNLVAAHALCLLRRCRGRRASVAIEPEDLREFKSVVADLSAPHAGDWIANGSIDYDRFVAATRFCLPLSPFGLSSKAYTAITEALL